jgi:hypothetical protein
MLDGEDPNLEGRQKAVFEEKLAKLRSAKPVETPDEPTLPQ